MSEDRTEVGGQLSVVSVGDEAVIPDHHELTDERVRLNPASLTDIYSLLYFNEGSDEAILSNRATMEIDGLHNRDVFTERDIDYTCMLDFWLCHEGLA
jgi:hypothetical protein